MAIKVDTVYQVVLSILNKEQRGYLSPEKFNLFANQAQLDIFEQYFYDIDMYEKRFGNMTDYSDMLELLYDKISIFEKSATLSVVGGVYSLPADLYRVGPLFYNGNEIEQVTKKQYHYYNLSPTAGATDDFPIYIRDENGIKVMGASEFTTQDVEMYYIKQPSTVIWNYTKVSNNALYNAVGSVDFEIHQSDTIELVLKILALAGVEVRELQVFQLAVQEELKKQQLEKSNK